jgi:hypothetical protein
MHASRIVLIHRAGYIDRRGEVLVSDDRGVSVARQQNAGLSIACFPLTLLFSLHIFLHHFLYLYFFLHLYFFLSLSVSIYLSIFDLAFL